MIDSPPLRQRQQIHRSPVPHRSTQHKMNETSRILWRILTASALFIGLVSLRYALPHVPFPAGLPNYTINRRVLIIHAVSASLALLLGPWQFLPGFRQRRPQVHRWTGRAYAIALFVAALAAIWIAPNAAGGHVSSAGFLGLAFGWVFTTSMGIMAIRRHCVASHRRWMIRSYGLTASAITLRFYLALLPLFHLRFAQTYPAISWLCWVPNLLLAEIWIRWSKTSERQSSTLAPSVPS
jgi:uncharacterized membrane protein